MLEKFLPTHTILGIGFEHLSNELFAHVGYIIDGSWEIKVFLVDHNLELVDVLGIIWGSSKEHPVVTDAQRIHISLIAILQIIENLGCHVEWRSQHGLGQMLSSQHLAESKISNLGHTVVPEDVGQFEISVKDLVLIEMVETIDTFTENLYRLLLSQKLPLFDIHIKITFVAILKDKVVVVASFLHIVQLDDVMTLATLKHLDLTLKEFLELAFDVLPADGLDCNVIVGGPVVALVDLTVLPRSYLST